MNKRIFLAMIMIRSILISQELPTIVPPPPNTASLAQNVEVPVSMYTGLPNISVPFYTISQKDIDIPINISYHARGVKLAELASSYGMGWTLNAGGVITRQIRGNADDSGVGSGYLNQSWYDDFFTSETRRENAYVAEINGQFDRMPDQFIFNFLGFSGKFIYDRDTNQPILNTFSDLKIETIGDPSSGIEGFIVTDTKGIKYYFGRSSSGIVATESTLNITDYSYSQHNGLSSNNSSAPSNTSAWLLLEIIPLSGKSIIFNYDVEYSTTFQKSEEVAERVNNDFVKTSYFSEVRNKQQKVKNIVFDQGEIEFTYNAIRDDLKGYLGSTPTALSSIVITNNNNIRIKRYDFEYEYTESIENDNTIPFLNTNAPEAKKRLFLKSIRQQSNDNIYLSPYEFTYNSTVLPSRFSTSHDRWGYYNAKNNGIFSVFAENIQEVSGTIIDTVKVQAGILTKVQFPTGGIAEYFYESNRAEFPEFLADHIVFQQGNGNNPEEEKYAVLDKDPVFYDFNLKEYSIPFTVGESLVRSNPNGPGDLFTSVFLDDPDCTNVESNDCEYFIRINRADGSTYAVLHNSTQLTQIYPGDYVLKVIPTNKAIENPYDGNDNFGIQLNWQEYSDSNQDPLEIIFTGGCRIKKTILNDTEGNTIKKFYEYKYSNGKTSGKVFSLPPYYAYSNMTTSGGNPFAAYHHVMFRPANKLTLEQGNHGGYAFVTEYIGDKTNNIGKNEYTFNTFYDGGLYYEPAYHLPDDNERMRGKPLQILNYKKDGGSYTLVKKTVNNYDYGLEHGVPGTYKIVDLIVFDNIRNLNSGTFDPATAHNYYKIFNLKSSIVSLVGTETTNYYENGSVKSYTSNHYNYQNHYQIKKIQNIDSKGEKTVEQLIYPQDKPTALTVAEQQMINNNQFNIIELSTFTDSDDDMQQDANELLSTSKTTYKDWGSNRILPERVLTSKGSGALEPRLEYKRYDSYGNPTEVKQTNGPTIVYLWGYNGQYPVAKIANASYTAVINTGVNLSILTSTTSSESSKLTELNKIRNHSTMSNAQVTTYTYDPLVGVSTITDPRGVKTSYDYDSFNRLEFIRDETNKLLEQYKYHYKN